MTICGGMTGTVMVLPVTAGEVITTDVMIGEVMGMGVDVDVADNLRFEVGDPEAGAIIMVGGRRLRRARPGSNYTHFVWFL